MKNLQIFLLLGVVVLAGCVGQTAAPGATNGVIIKSFVANPSQADPDVPVTFDLVIQNVGGREAGKVSAKLIGLTGEWLKGSSGTDLIDDAWRNGAALKGDATDKLFAPDASRGIAEGQEEFKSWEARGPKKDVDITYDSTIRVEYDYATKAESLLRVVSKDQFRQTQEKGGIRSTQISGGPLVVTLRAPTTVIDVGQNIPLQIEIQNVGGGKVKSNKVGVTFGAIDTLDVTVAVSGGAEVAGALCDKENLRLIGGKSGIISCKLDPTIGTQPFIDMSLSITVDYRYFVDSTTQVSILKQVA